MGWNGIRLGGRTRLVNVMNDDDKTLSLQSAILKIGTARLGPPPLEIRRRLEQIGGLKHLEELVERAGAIVRWSELLDVSKNSKR